MIITNLESVLKEFATEKSAFSAVLIDGKYGCGKTHTITDFLKNNKADYFYISLFGVDSVNTLLSKLADKINSTEIIMADGRLFFDDRLEKDQNNGFIVVFDDLERTSPDINFSSICGIFESLLKFGYKIICIVNSDAESIKGTNYYYDFCNKVFDKIVKVTPDYRLLNDVLENNEFAPSQSIIGDADCNWRIVKKAYKFFKEFELLLTRNKIRDFYDRAKTDKSLLFRSFVIAVKCVSKENKTKPKLSSDYAKASYEIEVEHYGEDETNNLREVFNNNSENSSLQHLTKLLVISIKECDYSSLLNEYYANGLNDKLLSTEPFNELLFYLDDKGKVEYKKAFLSNIKKFDFSQRAHANIAAAVIGYFVLNLTTDEINLIVSQIVKTITKNELNVLLMQITSDNKVENDALFRIKNLISEEYDEKNKFERHNRIYKAFKDKDYNYLIDLLYNNNYLDNKEGLSIVADFAKNNFLLPDLSKRINSIEWAYCHEIARYVSRYHDYIKAFIDTLEKQCAESNSRTVIERCNALIKYNFNNTSYRDYRIKREKLLSVDE